MLVISELHCCENNSITENNPESIEIVDEFDDSLITYGWISSGVYTLFHPGVLNRMQLQLPYILLSLIQIVSSKSTDGPEADSFLWDGCYCLPTLRLNLHIISFSCIPSQKLFKAVLQQLTSRVSATILFLAIVAVSYLLVHD